ncbi:unnamed protein product [Pleuronectes platessa]|uniref:Uncharacterized protein n=1 Tax=Pleuronectes platessa TaxID=8262 RepID=A0A9N7VKE6_PLEPL|nr:unnamed protein product [Pleuronectes platessa]
MANGNSQKPVRKTGGNSITDSVTDIQGYSTGPRKFMKHRRRRATIETVENHRRSRWLWWVSAHVWAQSPIKSMVVKGLEKQTDAPVGQVAACVHRSGPVYIQVHLHPG